MAQLVPHLRNVEKVDVVIMTSELGLANNIRLAEKFPGIGIDVILSSDMHEETRQPVVVTDPATGNVLAAANIRVRMDDNGDPLDGADVVARYLESLPGRTANPQLNRIRLLQPLPPSPAGFYVIQPLRGATLTPAPIHTAKKGGIHRAADDNDSD